MSNGWWGITVSGCALLFTVGSFWWLQMRRGHLKGYAPHSFAAYFEGIILFLRFPLVIYNTGAASLVVLDLQLKFPDEPESIIPLPWRTSRSQLSPSPGDLGSFPGAFAIAGRSAEQHFIEFGGPWPGIQMKAGETYRCRIEAKLGHNQKWKELVTFPLALPRMMNPSTNTTYKNSPWQPSTEDIKKIDAFSNELIQLLEATKRALDGED